VENETININTKILKSRRASVILVFTLLILRAWLKTLWERRRDRRNGVSSPWSFEASEITPDFLLQT